MVCTEARLEKQMTALESASAKLLSAIEQQDFEAVSFLLAERSLLLSAGAEVTPQAADLGNAARDALLSVKQMLMEECSRLDQIRRFGNVLSAPPDVHIAYFG